MGLGVAMGRISHFPLTWVVSLTTLSHYRASAWFSWNPQCLLASKFSYRCSAHFRSQECTRMQDFLRAGSRDPRTTAKGGETRSHPRAPRSMLVLASSRLATAPCNQLLLVTHPSPPKIIQICRQLSELSLILPTDKQTKAIPWSPWRR